MPPHDHGIELPTVVVVDDHPLFRRGLADMLDDEGMTVLAQVGTVADGLAAIEEHRPDVVLMDLHLPDGSGVAAIRQVATHHPAARQLVLSMDSSDAAVVAALQAGARGYLLKETAAESIVDTLAAMLRGELVVDSALAPRLVTLLSAGSHSESLDDLTPREVEILGLVAMGLSNTDIGRRLFLAEKTVRNNVTTLLAKTAQPSRAALIAFARDRGLGVANSPH